MLDFYKRQLQHDLALVTPSYDCQLSLLKRADLLTVNCLCSNQGLDPELMERIFLTNWAEVAILNLKESYVFEQLTKSVFGAGQTHESVTFLHRIPSSNIANMTWGVIGTAPGYGHVLAMILNESTAVLDPAGVKAWDAYFDMLYEWTGPVGVLAQTVAAAFMS